MNVDNIGDISKAAGMFTPEDLEAIMRAIHEYNHCTRKLINNETETKYRIGSQELTLKEWDKMISDFDEKQDYVREAMREEVKDRISDEDREEMIRKLFEDRDELLSVI